MSEVKEIEIKQIVVNIPEPFKLLIDILGKADEIDDIINNKLKLGLDQKSRKIVGDIIVLLLQGQDSTSPIRQIIDRIREILADGKIDSYDIPVLVKIVTDILNLNRSQLKSVKFELKDAGVIIKIIISILLNLEVIKENPDLIMRMIDSSLALLETSLQVAGFKWSRIFPCCCK